MTVIQSLANQFAAAGCTETTFFGLVPWYHYLTVVDSGKFGCSISNFDGSNPQSVLGLHSPFLLIALAVVDDLIRVAALFAVGYVIYGGITYATSEGSPDATSKAKSSIVNALIGLVIALIAIGLVSFLGNTLGGSAVSGAQK